MKISLAALAIVAFLLLAATAAKADNIVSVSLNPYDFGEQVSYTGQDLGREIIAATFTWDLTTETISNVVLAVSGPFQLSPNSNFYGPIFYQDGGIEFLSWGLNGGIYSLNYGLHFPQGLPSTPGTHYADLNLTCFCMSGDQDATFGTATVTAVGDPVATPEPGTLALIGVGLAGLLARRRLQARRNHVPKAVWEPLA